MTNAEAIKALKDIWFEYIDHLSVESMKHIEYKPAIDMAVEALEKSEISNGKSNESEMDLINRIECAIRHIQTATDVDPWAVEIAVEALKKQIPKKPYVNVIHYPYTSDLTTVQCPNCKRRLRTRRTQANGDRFCPDCGQAIDWEGE